MEFSRRTQGQELSSLIHISSTSGFILVFMDLRLRKSWHIYLSHPAKANSKCLLKSITTVKDSAE